MLVGLRGVVCKLMSSMLSLLSMSSTRKCRHKSIATDVSAKDQRKGQHPIVNGGFG